MTTQLDRCAAPDRLAERVLPRLPRQGHLPRRRRRSRLSGFGVSSCCVRGTAALHRRCIGPPNNGDRLYSRRAVLISLPPIASYSMDSERPKRFDCPTEWQIRRVCCDTAPCHASTAAFNSPLPFPSSFCTWFRSATACCSSLIASVASSSGGGKSSPSSRTLFLQPLEPIELELPSPSLLRCGSCAKRSSFESAGLRFARPFGSAP